MTVSRTPVRPRGCRQPSCQPSEFIVHFVRCALEPCRLTKGQSCRLLNRVHWRDPSTTSSVVHQLANSSAHYRGSPDTFTHAIEEVLQVDVRSKDQTKRWADASAVSEIVIDNARIEYRVVLPEATSPVAASSTIETNSDGEACADSEHAERAPTQPMRVFITAVTPA